MKSEPKNDRDLFIGDYIHVVRGMRVMLDETLANLYGVPIKRLNEQVRRNISRFPSDFMLHLTQEESTFLRSQFVTLRSGWGKHRKYRPHAFTEQGIAMLSGVLKSPRAIQVNIHIMRAFVVMRKYAITHEDLAKRIDELEGKYDEQFAVVFEALRRLAGRSPVHKTGCEECPPRFPIENGVEPPQDGKRRIGFLTEERAPYVVFN